MCLIQVSNDDAVVVLNYFAHQQAMSGYTGPIAISIERLAQIHLAKSVAIADLILRQLMSK